MFNFILGFITASALWFFAGAKMKELVLKLWAKIKPSPQE